VPEEFAAAYRAAYEQALAAQTDGPQHREHPPERQWQGLAAADSSGGEDAFDEELPRRRGPLRLGTHGIPEEYDDSPTWFEKMRDSAWFVPILLALLAALLILGAYSVGRRFADRVGSDASPDAQPTLVTGTGGPGAGQQPVTNQQPGEGAWPGQVALVGGVKAKAGCTAKPAVDASGARVSYAAGNLVDGAADTTWRCDGSAIGEKISLDLGTDVEVGQVGLVPGYAKTDEVSKADRYAENNRVTRVRWTIGNTEVVQQMSGAPDDRSLQLLRVPKARTDTVDLEILAVRKGPRDTTAISEIQVWQAR
jgi:hypothetical protein